MASGEGDHHHGDLGPDPFAPTPTRKLNAFEAQLLSPERNQLATSPEEAKAQLKQLLADNERKIEEAGRLGQTLVNRQDELMESLKEVEVEAQSEGGISGELARKLQEIEREFNEAGRDSSRILGSPSKSRASSGEMGAHLYDPKRSASPSKYESQGAPSPTKLSVPNHKVRNKEPTKRLHDIEFATEISTSLLAQVRQLQQALAEKEEALKNATFEKGVLVQERETFNLRLRALDESENRYKDENWNLETQIHEHIAKEKEAADREKKLTQALNLLQAEKTNSQKELDEIKLNLSKLTEQHAAAMKTHDVELGALKRTVANVENEKETLQSKVKDITSQNTELAKAITRQRALSDEHKSNSPVEENVSGTDDNGTPDNSPPPSPIKNTPRHSHLEAETMKSSLQHAHRMIQSLKGNIHREKTEKLELKRMLQDARDEIELRRAEAPPAIKKSRKTDSKEFKKPYKPNQLGGMRNSRSEVSIEEMAWEDHDMESSPTRQATSRVKSMPGGYESTDQFDTSNEASTDAYLTANNSDAFETANERDTETDAFVTTNEGNTDSDELTETEGANMGTIRANKHQRPASLMQIGNRNSYNSTASLSGDEYSYGNPTTPKQPARINLRQHRGSHSSGRTIIEDFYASSPPQPSTNATPQRQSGGQTLFDQLGELSEGESYTEATSSVNTPMDGRSRNVSIIGTPAPANIPLPPVYVPKTPKEEVVRPKMVDSGVMTDAWEPISTTPNNAVQNNAVPAFGGLLAGAGVVEAAHQLRERTGGEGERERPMSDASSQWYGEQDDRLSALGAYNNRMSMMSTTSTQPGDIAERLEHFPTPPGSAPMTVSLSMSTIQATIDEEPMEPELKPSKLPEAMSFSSIATTAVQPVTPVERPTPKLAFAPIQTVGTEAIEAVVRPVTPVKMAFAPMMSTIVEPCSPTPPQLGFASVAGIETEPVAPVLMPAPTFAMANIAHTAVAPIESVQKVPEPLNFGFSSIEGVHTEPTAIESVEDRIKHEMPGALPETPFESPLDEPKMAFASIQSTEFEPVTPRSRPVTPVNYGISNILSTDVEPLTPKARPATPIKLVFSDIGTTIVNPVEPMERPQTPVNLGFSTVKTAAATVPMTPIQHPITPPRPVTPVVLSFTGINQIATEPVSPPSPRPSSKRDGFFIPSDEDPSELETKLGQPETPKGFLGGVTKWAKEKTPAGMLIAEDETSTRDRDVGLPSEETPESQRPFKEITGNTDVKPVRTEKKTRVPMEDSMAQTMLTSEQIEAMFRSKAERRASNAQEERDAINVINSANISPTTSMRANVLPPAIRVRRSQDNGVTRPMSRSKTMNEALSDSENDATLGSYFMRPDSGRRSSLNSHPPLPPNHQQVIKEAEKRTGSSASNKPGLMGPPALPASAFRAQSANSNKAFGMGPITPRGSSAGIHSPQRNGTTPRAHRSEGGTADVFGPMPPISQSGLSQVRSRASSITSFTSEVESRFGLRNGDPGAIPGMGTGTDPRMIQAITQTMIGEYLWKYTRRTGSSSMSSTRHRRYFWVHPYTRTLYWSDRDPATGGGKGEMKAKSVQIEAVRVVGDDNVMPPGLHRKSLVVVARGREVKVTAITGQRHECWFNALSYLLLRGEDQMPENDSDEVIGGLTSGDVQDFNPSIHSRSRSRKGPASLSSYNSRTTGGRGESPGKHSVRQPSGSIVRPKMSYDTTASRQSMVSRLSNYWHPRDRRDGSQASTSRRDMSSRLSRRSEDGRAGHSIYEASEVADSAEDLRREMERQERESDRVENVRACCDGKHDVGHLSHTPTSERKKSRMSLGAGSQTPSRSGRHTPGVGGRSGAVSRQSIPE